MQQHASPARVDEIINQHFMFEATDDVDGVMASLAPGAEHEVVPSPCGRLQEPARIREFYRRLFTDLKGDSVTPLRRLYGPGFVVDETLWHGEILDGRQFLCEGRSGKVSFRMLHVFELEGDLIKREDVWCDLAAIQRQLGVRAA